MVNKEVIIKLLNSISEDINHIKSKGKITLSTYETNRDLRKICERNLETAIQSIIDISNHIIAEKSLGFPDSYSDSIKLLAENKIIPKKFYQILIKMVSLRNKLAHEYKDILNVIIVNIINNNLNDFEKFIFYIKKYLKI